VGGDFEKKEGKKKRPKKGGGGVHDFYSVPNVAAIIDWRRIRCAGM